jgi:DNA-directed RNA polymerase subunit F
MVNLKDLFDNWKKLNDQANDSIGKFDFSKIKEVRKKQEAIENSIFKILNEKAPKKILDILPDDCGQMEMGFNDNKNIFYFVMVDDELSTDDDLKLQAISINLLGEIEVIKNFKIIDE